MEIRSTQAAQAKPSLRERQAPAEEKHREGAKPELDSASVSEAAKKKDEGNPVSRFFGNLVHAVDTGLNKGIDWVENTVSEGADKAADMVKDVPVLGAAARAQAWFTKQSIQLVGGVAKGATTMVTGLANMAVHPVDTVKGLFALGEHLPLLPVNPLRLLHGAYDVAVNGKDPSKTMLEAVNPVDMLADSARFGKALVKGITDPYAASIREGKYSEALGRGVFDVGSLVLTAGAGGAVKGGATVAKEAGVAAKAGEAADVTRLAYVAEDAVKLGGHSNKVAHAIANLQEGASVVISRSSGAIEGGWKVLGRQANGRVRVFKEGVGFKDLRPEALLANNPQLGKAAVATTKSVDQAVGELIGREGLENLRGANPQRLGDKIYREIYNPAGEIKKATIGQEAYSARLREYPMSISDGYWHRRFGTAGAVESGDIQRFYFNVLPDAAPGLADDLTRELNAAGIKFQYKMPDDLANFNRSDAAVLYVNDADLPQVNEIVGRITRQSPGAFAEGSPAFTKPISKGVAMAEEPIQDTLPARYGGHSFGTSRADIVAEAVSAAPEGASMAQVMRLVRENFARYGLDADRPWLRRVH